MAAAIAANARSVTHGERQTMSDGAEDPEARRILDDMHRMVIDGWSGQTVSLRTALSAALQEVEVARQNRLMAAVDFIPDEVWLSVMISALAVLIFSAMLSRMCRIPPRDRDVIGRGDRNHVVFRARGGPAFRRQDFGVECADCEVDDPALACATA